MKSIFHKLLLLLVLAGFTGLESNSYAQGNVQQGGNIQNLPDHVVINNIFIIGNEKTRKNIILRELNLRTGITYEWEDLLTIIEADQQKIYNLQLFNSVEITPLLTGTEQIEILITVTERRYIIPSLIFDLADRNLAEWWTNQNRSLSRVNYGARIHHNNVGGRNEKLRFIGQLGFTKALDVLYSIPYLDKDQKHGIAAQFTYFTNKTISVRSLNNRQVFYTNENEEELRKNISAYLRYSFRGSFYNFHFATLGYVNTWINDSVFVQNPDYFLHEGNNLSYFVAGYNFRHDRRDYNSYPTNGALLDLSITKYGLWGRDKVNDWEFTAKANRYLKFNDKFHFVSGLAVNAYLKQQQPYALVRGIGYNPNFIRGYELNVVEGQQMFVHKNSLRYNLIDIGYDISNIVPIEGFSYFPIKLYLSANFDQGFVNDRNRIPENLRLTNKYLFGYGPGLDLVILYDIVLRFEYSVNSQNEGNFFFNFRAPF